MINVGSDLDPYLFFGLKVLHLIYVHLAKSSVRTRRSGRFSSTCASSTRHKRPQKHEQSEPNCTFSLASNSLICLICSSLILALSPFIHSGRFSSTCASSSALFCSFPPIMSFSARSCGSSPFLDLQNEPQPSVAGDQFWSFSGF